MSHEPMNSKNDPHEQAAELRRRAEDILRERMAQVTDTQKNLPPEARKTLHDLQVHQIELEMQNEELRRAQTELVIAKDRYFDFYNLAPVGYITVNDKGLILEVNLTCATLLGVARIDLVKQSMSRFILPEDQDIFYFTRKNVFTTSEPQICDLRMVKKDGTVFWVCLTSTAARDESGSPLYRIVLTDIAERKQAENALRESEERLKFLVKNSLDSLVIVNADGSQRYVSPAAERITGFPIAELQGRTLDTLIHPDDIKDIQAAWKEVVEHPEKTVTVQYRHIHKTQGWVFSEAIAQSFLFEPTINGVIASVRDITERKKAEDAIGNSNKLLHTVINTAPMRVFFKDLELRYIGCNNAFSKDAGVGCPEDLIDKNDYELAWKEQAELYRADDRRVIDNGVPKLSYDEPQTTPEGNSEPQFPFSSRLRPGHQATADAFFRPV